MHARGISFRAEVKPADDVDEAYMSLAEALSMGDTLVRLAPGQWTGDRGVLPDVLGIAMRFGADASDNFKATERSQDLLMMTAKRLITLPLAMFSTNQRDFLGNVYHGGAPFEVAGRPNMRLRLVPITLPEPSEGNRWDKLRKAVADGEAKFRLEVVSKRDPKMSSPLVEISLVEELVIDDEELAFWPFAAGLGIIPEGFVQWMRPVPYVLSQFARNM